MGKTYVMSDLHGSFYTFLNMLKKIKFTNEDNLFIIGDVVDRGKNSIELLKYCMNTKNIYLILGNHEKMMLNTLHHMQDPYLSDIYAARYNYSIWTSNGGNITLDLFEREDKETQKQIVTYLESLPDYKFIKVNEKGFLLIHAGVIIPSGKILNNKTFNNLINKSRKKDDHLFSRDMLLCDKSQIEDFTVIFGHTIVLNIKNYRLQNNKQISIENIERCNDFKIYKTDNMIGIDCLALKINLGCLCLDTMEEFYEKTSELDLTK